MIELIFAIVIIGVLTAVALPNFLNLKESAEANNVVKTTIDSAAAAVSAAVNLKNLEGNNTFELEDLVKLEGKWWRYLKNSGNPYGLYIYEKEAYKPIARIRLDRARNMVTYEIYCDRFSDPATKKKCKEILNGKDSVFVKVPY